MKKTLIILLFLCVLAISAITLAGCAGVCAEEIAVTPPSSDKSEFAIYWEDKLYPLIGSFAASLAAIIVPLVPIFGALKSFKKENSANNIRITELSARNELLMEDNARNKAYIKETNELLHKLIQGDEITRLNCPLIVSSTKSITTVKAVYEEGANDEVKAD